MINQTCTGCTTLNDAQKQQVSYLYMVADICGQLGTPFKTVEAIVSAADTFKKFVESTEGEPATPAVSQPTKEKATKEKAAKEKAPKEDDAKEKTTDTPPPPPAEKDGVTLTHLRELALKYVSEGGSGDRLKDYIKTHDVESLSLLAPEHYASMQAWLESEIKTLGVK